MKIFFMKLPFSFVILLSRVQRANIFAIIVHHRFNGSVPAICDGNQGIVTYGALGGFLCPMKIKYTADKSICIRAFVGSNN